MAAGRLAALFILWTGLAAAAPWADPPLLAPGPGGVLSLDAYTDTVDVPGLGRVHGASFYDLRRGSADRPAPGRRSLMPPVLQIAKGSSVELHLHNHLTTIDAADLDAAHPPRPGDATNVHTHGLLVPPTGTGFGTAQPRLGDCVLPLAASTAGGGSGHPAHAAGLGADPCASGSVPGMPLVSALVYAYPIPVDHPSGLFWIHPHPHTQSEIQLSNGLSGMMAIGTPWDSLFFGCRLSASVQDGTGACRTQAEQRQEQAQQDAARSGALRVRYFGLKDIQVRPRPGSAEYDLIPFPSRPPAPTDAFGAANNARKSRCGDLPRVDGDADVTVPGATTPPPGICRNTDGAAWVFTVSGQVFPRIEVEERGTELWRIANMSADVSYRLQLKGEDGTLYRMRPVALDGVAIAVPPNQAVGAAAGAKGASTAGAAVAEIVLMPSARIEVLVERCGADPAPGCVPADRAVHASLRTRGMVTGIGEDGDRWPAIDLVDVVFPASLRAASGRRAPLPPMRVAAALAVPLPSPPPAIASAPPPAPSPAAGCAGTDHGPARFPLGGTQARLIRLNNAAFGTDEAFGIHDELASLKRLADGTPVTLATLIDEGAASPTGPSLISDLRLPDPCDPIDTAAGFRAFYRPFDMTQDNVTVRHGTEEYWLVVNDSPECHNFHIHQMKFSVMDADFRGTAAALSGGAPIASDQCAGDRTAIRPINQAAVLDNYPLPPAARVLFRVRFDGPKLGRFVFHCHILEHEDKGMMALLNVVE